MIVERASKKPKMAEGLQTEKKKKVLKPQTQDISQLSVRSEYNDDEDEEIIQEKAGTFILL